MEFIFQITNYDDPALDGEAVELLRQRLEVKSRQTHPALWKLMDHIETRAIPEVKAHPRRYVLRGAAMIALGVFSLVLGLAPPPSLSLTSVGVLAILLGLLSIRGVKVAKVKSPPQPPASCKKEAAELLAGRRAVDWSEPSVKVCFDEEGMTVSDGENREAVPYGDMTEIFETERLWLLAYSGERALLLQKKDMVLGEAGDFLPFLQENIDQSHLS